MNELVSLSDLFNQKIFRIPAWWTCMVSLGNWFWNNNRHVKGMTITNEIVDKLFDFGFDFITSPF